MRQRPRHEPVPVEIPACGVFALESHHAGDFRMEPSQHDFLEVFYVLSGRGRFLVDGCAYPSRRGDVIIVPPQIFHRIEDDRGAPLSLYGVCATADVLRHDLSLADSLGAGRLHGRRMLDRQIASDLRALLFEQTYGRPGSGAMMVGTALRLLGMLLRAAMPRAADHVAESGDGGRRDLIRSYVEELNHRFFERTDLDHAAERLGMSRRRFTQLFREETGDTWLNYVHGLRTRYACRLLNETRESVESIAFSCGYDNLSSFYRVFKQQQGVSPDRWRNVESRHADRRSAPSLARAALATPTSRRSERP